MKLAEALILRKDCKTRLDQLKIRIVGNAKVQEGDEPAESPQDLIQEMEQVGDELLSVISRINRTNSITAFDGDKTLSDALAERDVLMLRRNAYTHIASAGSVVQTRTSRSEIKFNSTVNVREIQERIDALSKSYRELDSRIQALNWLTDIVE